MKRNVLGGIWGLCVADALGVSFEFRSQEELKQTLATGRCGYDAAVMWWTRWKPPLHILLGTSARRQRCRLSGTCRSHFNLLYPAGTIP